MKSVDAFKLIEERQKEQSARNKLAKDVLEWFLDNNIGDLYPRDTVGRRLADELDVDFEQANRAITNAVDDIVDPLQ